ncbi:Bro-N domain-containing protein [Pseudomonas baetica]|uniref:BRO-N domain-containing protein n=1 Tax=Pseudomonas TaxID=286 RepID=UPI001C8B5C5C|nr:Bro-N domain-containing protein [Pseudomonas baetica]MBX9405301.1 Bro-N domain-containing protein [Pseudomonas baetica]
MIKVTTNAPKNAGSQFSRESLVNPQAFIRHHIQLQAALVHGEAWFCARDIGRLMGLEINGRQVLKLDEDQRRMMFLSGNDGVQETLMLSESGVYAMLVYHYSPENRHLRRWLTHEVVPMLHQDSTSVIEPHLRLMMCAGETLSLLHWRNEPWIRMRDMPSMLAQEGLGCR